MRLEMIFFKQNLPLIINNELKFVYILYIYTCKHASKDSCHCKGLEVNSYVG